MAKLVEIKTVIEHGTLRLDVPSGMDVNKALSSYAENYPELSVAMLSEPSINNGVKVYKVEKNEKIGTKG